jgi:peptidoglycan/LPS O-acetylase OafA/YrhL
MSTLALARATPVHAACAHRADYRPDIDGLRALSVVAVILFHARLPGIGGGFVGVDVFFVISGFLITRLLLERPERPTWTRLREFYLRRARRILPALLVVLWASALGAWLLFAPVELIGFGHFVAASAAMLANLAAWRSGGYFDTPWATTPLLHLWSIAVVEQFYLLFPLLLMVLQRRLAPRWRVALVAAAALLSLALCIWASYARPAANYYAAPTRAWELLVGSLLALGVVPPPGRALREPLAWLALLLLAGACLLLDGGSRYPGWRALIPTLATAILIVTGGSRINRALACGPLVFVGLISYSLYLWHVPVLTLSGYYNVVPLSAAQIAMLLPVIGLLATLTWLCVERPVRLRRWLGRNAVFVWSAAACSALTVAGGLALAHSDGYPQRFPAEVRPVFDASKLFGVSGTRCMGLKPVAVDAGRLCRSGAADGARTIMLWGDSHAWALLPAVEEIASKRGAQVWFAAWPACRPLPDLPSSLPAESQANCAAFNAAMVRAARRLAPEVIVLDAYWMFGDAGADPARIARGVATLLGEVGGSARACVVHGVPVYDASVPDAMSVARLRGLATADLLALPRVAALRQQRAFDAAFSGLAARGAIRAFDPKSALCAAASCRLETEDGLPLYRDGNHLSVTGALALAPELDTCLR